MHSVSEKRRYLYNKVDKILILITAVIVVLTVLIGFARYVESDTESTQSNESEVIQKIKIEAGSKIPEALTFLKDHSLYCFYLTDTTGIDTSIPKNHDLLIKVNDKIYSVTLEIVDTTAPMSTPVNKEIWLGESVSASELVTNIKDTSGVTCSFIKEPDLSRSGQQDVVILLEDEYGNTSQITSTLTIIEDNIPPVITGAANQTIYIGETISYKKGVTVSDNRDDQVLLTIDNSAVNLSAAGSYPVTYSAIDKAGNKTDVTVTITVIDKPEDFVTEDELNVLVDKILDDLLQPGMDDLEKLCTIFYFIGDHIQYTGSSDKTDWICAAYAGLTKGTGDCYNYFAASRALLDRAGFGYIPIERVPEAKTRHYWLLVKYNGAYYHFDPTPHHPDYRFVCLLRTDAEIAEYTKIREAVDRPYYYTFNPEGIPPSAAEPLNIERDIRYG